MSTKVVAPEQKNSKKERAFSVKIHQPLAQAIRILAAQRQIQAETLVNEILEEHLATQSISDAEFLLSLAGMFNSEPSVRE